MFACPAPWDLGFVGLEKISTSVLSMWNPGLAKTSALDALSFRGQHSHYSVVEATKVFGICSPWGARSWSCSFSSFLLSFSLYPSLHPQLSTPFLPQEAESEDITADVMRRGANTRSTSRGRLKYNIRFPACNHRLWCPSTQSKRPALQIGMMWSRDPIIFFNILLNYCQSTNKNRSV